MGHGAGGAGAEGTGGGTGDGLSPGRRRGVGGYGSGHLRRGVVGPAKLGRGGAGDAVRRPGVAGQRLHRRPGKWASRHGRHARDADRGYGTGLTLSWSPIRASPHRDAPPTFRRVTEKGGTVGYFGSEGT